MLFKIIHGHSRWEILNASLQSNVLVPLLNSGKFQLPATTTSTAFSRIQSFSGIPYQPMLLMLPVWHLSNGISLRFHSKLSRGGQTILVISLCFPCALVPHVEARLDEDWRAEMHFATLFFIILASLLSLIFYSTSDLPITSFFLLLGRNQPALY